MKKEFLDPEDMYASPLPDLAPLQVKCPGCDSMIPTDQINIHHNLAKCEQCESIYQLHNTIPFRHKPEIFMPKGIEVLELTNELDIELSWKRELKSAVLFFTLFWNAIVFIVAAGAILSGNYFALLFMSLHLSVGIGLIYYQLTLFFNRTNIIVDQDRILIEHRPLKVPFYNNRNIPSADIEQIYVEKYEESRTNDVPNYAFAISAVFKNKRKERLIKGIMHIDQAQYIEQEIENFLHIQDEKVDGEFGHKN